VSIETIIALITALGVGGILGALLNQRFEQQKQTHEHDIKIFGQSNKILTEQKLVFVVDFHVLGNHSIMNDDFYKLTEWCEFFGAVGNQYLDRRIAKETQRLVDDLNQLTDFIASNFFTRTDPNPNDKFQYLRPDWNEDRGGYPNPEQMEKYDVYAKEMKDMARKVIKQHSEYRRTIKQILKM
jgi:hypothetical protein